MKRLIARWAFVLFVSAPAAVAVAGPSPFSNLLFRHIGPAIAGGRVTSVVGAPGKSNLYYVGTAGGGVWKTVNGGYSWHEVFAHEPTQSIGTVKLDPGHPDWVWVGTGGSNPRVDVLNGRGVYFSPDGGKNWESKGLKDVGQIGAIVVNPDNPQNVYVCATGNLWKPTSDRGVYMTTDGGQHWTKVLYLNNHTGCSDIAMMPGNPSVLIAGMWPLQRSPWELISGGKSGGIYRSIDGGKTWRREKHGLPAGPIGRSAIAFAPSAPQTVYALIQAKAGVLWVSHDMGMSWHLVSNNHAYDVRPFYFTQLAVAPNDPDRLYMLSMKLMESNNGGKTAFYADPGVHVDHHAIWIDPKDANRIMIGNDGGVYLSKTAGKHWRYLDNLPIEQFYQVAVANTFPFLLCGGLQDNNAWCGSSSDYRRGGVVGDGDWFPVAGGDGQYVVPAPSNPNIIYATTDDGFITRYDRKTNRSRSINPYLKGLLAGTLLSGKPMSKQKYRFGWTTPIAVSATDPNDVYLGANVVFHTMDGGRNWKVISPDLTRNVKAKQGPSGGPVTLDLSGATTYDVIQSLSLTPLAPKEIWVGTDDGLVWLSRDNGKHWQNVTPRGAPKWARVYHVTVSPFNPGTAYAAYDAHMLGNNRPYAYVTHDYGKHWHKITRGLPDASVMVVGEDPDHRGLLFAGTLRGLYYSLDGGKRWEHLDANLPVSTPVFDLAFAKRTHSLVIATHGSGLWVLDNLRPIEGFDASVAKQAFHLFKPSIGILLERKARGHSPGPGHYRAPNAPAGVVVSYYLRSSIAPSKVDRAQHHGPVKVVVSDTSGHTVDTVYGSGKRGMDHVVWNLRYRGPVKLKLAGAQGGFFGSDLGPRVVPGEYTLSVHVNGKVYKAEAWVKSDPRVHLRIGIDRSQTKLALGMRGVISAFDRLLNSVAADRRALGKISSRALHDSRFRASNKLLVTRARKLEKRLAHFESPLWDPLAQHGVSEDFLRYYTRLHMHLDTLYGLSLSAWDKPVSHQLVRLVQEDRNAVSTILGRYNVKILPAVRAFNQEAVAAGLSTLPTGKGSLVIPSAPMLPVKKFQ